MLLSLSRLSYVLSYCLSLISTLNHLVTLNCISLSLDRLSLLLRSSLYLLLSYGLCSSLLLLLNNLLICFLRHWLGRLNFLHIRLLHYLLDCLCLSLLIALSHYLLLRCLCSTFLLVRCYNLCLSLSLISWHELRALSWLLSSLLRLLVRLFYKSHL